MPDPRSKDSAVADVEAVWREESARIVASLARYTGDVVWAEDLAQDAFVEALDAWPADGIPSSPGGWLLTVGRRRAMDAWRRGERLARRQELLANDLRDAERDPVADIGDPDRIDDDTLRLVFVCCHPVLPAASRLALTLRVVAGLTTEQIARMMLLTTASVQQRIVRAKRDLRTADVPFEVPDRAGRPARLDSVLQVLHLMFTEGYAPSVGDEAVRADVATDAVRVARLLTALAPQSADTWALLALMELQSSRFAARRDTAGELVTMDAQDRTLWDVTAIARGRECLARSLALNADPGVYALQALIAQEHAVAGSTDKTDWSRIAALYAALDAVQPSAVVRLNRAVAVAMSGAVREALSLVDELERSGALASYRPLQAVKADLLARSGERDAAARTFRAAAELPGNAAEAAHLRRRAAELAQMP
ncbi:RNA polymerase sigma factor [Microbacterium rhizosphaerae]|uniref:Sigma-70 family RNA polymerase sigma factor n=1 Tax=Microbacterium rhizosphaerae TaxID=1678237 RepID=A0ABZ0SKP5_9MICO|nr:sigma-70 family RNA polymerase sigma factor [Microbacterium rhizosphaerae]WPR89967.1 sigma-70 family RNA polymerase sigma factor [Microbacterium rhizosphaerae]